MTLADFMAERGLTQDAVAKALGVTQPTVSRLIEKGSSSAEVAVAVERFTDGAVLADSLSRGVALARGAA